MDFGVNVSKFDQRPQILVVGSTPLLIGTGITLAISVLAIALNFCIIVAFFRNKRLVDAFTIHVLNLAVINLAAGLLLVFCFIPLHNFDLAWLRVRRNCGVYRFFTFYAMYMVIHQHLVICADRWLALVAPVWYHTKKQVKYGRLATVGCLGVGFLWTLAVVASEFTIPLPSDTYCSEPLPTVMRSVAITVAVLVPQGSIYLSYPFVLFFVWKRIRSRHQAKVPEQDRLTDPGTGTRIYRTSHAGNGLTETIEGSTTVPLNSGSIQARRKTASRHTIVVAWLALAQIVLWLPNTVIQLCRLEYAPLYTEDVVTSLSLLGSWLLLADPLIYLTFFPELLKETLKTVGIHRFRSARAS